MIIQPIKCSDVHEFDKIKFNSLNHWNGNPPLDYNIVNEQCNTCHWIDKLNKPYKKIIIDNKFDIEWMKLASNMDEIGF